MIVVDTNVIAYLFLDSTHTESARHWLGTDGDWHVPVLWRSEFKNILALYMRKNMLTQKQATAVYGQALSRLVQFEFQPDGAAVFVLAGKSGCTPYDCEFIATAYALKTRLLTADKPLQKAFPRETLCFTDGP